MPKQRKRPGGQRNARDPWATDRKVAQCRLHVTRLNSTAVLGDPTVLESAFRDFLHPSASIETHLAAEANLGSEEAKTWFDGWWKNRTPEERALRTEIVRWRAADFHALGDLSTKVSAVGDDARRIRVPLDEVPGRWMWGIEPAQRAVPRCFVVLANGEKVDAAERATSYMALLESLVADFRREHL